MIQIRNEQKSDYQIVEDITREAFYNMYVPGCMEHYLVHIMRGHEDFIPELDFVLELDGKVIGNIMYTKAKLTDENGEEKEIITFGPVSILPKYQRMGYGKLLMEHSFKRAVELGYDAIVIFGSPANYVSRGFKSCKKYNLCVEGGGYPAGMLAKELKEGAFDGRKWIYSGSPVMDVDEQEAIRFDDALPPMAKEYRPSQDEFYIISQAFLG
ncbi:MAG TPA: N-acetyltransferase [Candidatus Anaerobutyricum stercoris]|uniref:N-acetyltransferase n=1 Tax=Candidatus Anaerobutyricum stercoris TaxID=2838457 RepID=A0A9D2EMC9_9FIRM|nr:N-acetyltransferase [Eubacterium sp. An3]OUO27527.1 GNAT family N-acetyltransferase [Eubacterium sp. An3]HIZ40182.1 N-acetyltransferase [Candidatus Anaerobutyricum stercoris]